MSIEYCLHRHYAALAWNIHHQTTDNQVARQSAVCASGYCVLACQTTCSFRSYGETNHDVSGKELELRSDSLNDLT